MGNASVIGSPSPSHNAFLDFCRIYFIAMERKYTEEEDEDKLESLSMLKEMWGDGFAKAKEEYGIDALWGMECRMKYGRTPLCYAALEGSNDFASYTRKHCFTVRDPLPALGPAAVFNTSQCLCNTFQCVSTHFNALGMSFNALQCCPMLFEYNSKQSYETAMIIQRYFRDSSMIIQSMFNDHSMTIL